MLGGCGGPAYQPPRPASGEIASEEPGEIIMVRDVTIGAPGGPAVHSVGVPVASPLGIFRVPVKVPLGPRAPEVPGEELTVRLKHGGSMVIVQERSSPPLAIGEPVRVIRERENLITGVAKTRIERREY